MIKVYMLLRCSVKFDSTICTCSMDHRGIVFVELRQFVLGSFCFQASRWLVLYYLVRLDTLLVDRRLFCFKYNRWIWLSRRHGYLFFITIRNLVILVFGKNIEAWLFVEIYNKRGFSQESLTFLSLLITFLCRNLGVAQVYQLFCKLIFWLNYCPSLK